MEFKVYLSGEVHSDWRRQIAAAIKAAQLPVQLLSPVLDHAASDNIGSDVLGIEENTFWKDHKSAKINCIRTSTLIKRSDVVIVKFGEKYRQWNAAFDAGYATALGKPLITVHSPDLTHALKEIDAVALAVAQSPEQVVEILKYVTSRQADLDP